MTEMAIMEAKVPEFQLPEGFTARQGCKYCHGRGTTGFDTVRKVWLRCRCVKRKEQKDKEDSNN